MTPGDLDAEVLVSAEQRHKITLIGPAPCRYQLAKVGDEHCFGKASSALIGKSSRSGTHKARSAATGSQPDPARQRRHPYQIQSRRLQSVPKPWALHSSQAGAACSQSIQIKHNIRPCRKRVSAKKHLISSRNMPNERVSREPFTRRSRVYLTNYVRHCGLSKTRLQHLFVATSLNLVRMGTG